MEMGIECFRVEFPKGMDANEYALKVKPAAKSLGVLLNRAAWIGKGLGKGQRPEARIAVPVIVPEPVAVEPEIAAAANEEPAAKEKISEEEWIMAEIEAANEAESQAKIESAAIEEEPEPSPPEIPDPVFSLAALAEPVAPRTAVESHPAPVVEVRGGDIFVQQGDRRYRIRGLEKNMSHELLKVNVLVTGTNTRGESGFHVDTFDLYSARQRGLFTKQAAEELGIKEEVFRRDLGQVLFHLEGLQDEQIKQALAPKEEAVALNAAAEGK
jgi:DNA primase